MPGPFVFSRHHKSRLKRRAAMMSGPIVKLSLECTHCGEEWETQGVGPTPEVFQCGSCDKFDTGIRRDDHQKLDFDQEEGVLPC